MSRMHDSVAGWPRGGRGLAAGAHWEFLARRGAAEVRREEALSGTPGSPSCAALQLRGGQDQLGQTASANAASRTTAVEQPSVAPRMITITSL